MTSLTADQAERLARKTSLALTLAIILGTIEIIRRVPRWLLLVFSLLVYTVVLIAIVYVWWIVAVLAAVIVWKLSRGAVQGWRAPG